MKQCLVELNVEALRPIVEMADSHGLTVVFENYKDPFDCVSTYEALLERVPNLKVHLDFGHAHMGRDDGEAFCRHLGRHIMHVHFSDNRSTDDHHMPLGVGSIDWNRAVRALKAIGYDGTITLEAFCDDRRVLFQYLDISRRLLLQLWNGEGMKD
jgi:sugar phosphate isomerase/epimerase